MDYRLFEVGRPIVLPPERFGARSCQSDHILLAKCEKLVLRLADDPNTRLVASKIIELASVACEMRRP